MLDNGTDVLSALQKARFGVVVHTAELQIVSWNAGAEQIFGIAAAEAIGRKVPEIAGDSLRDNIRELVREDGSRVATRWQQAPLGEDSSLVFVTDVTEERERERIAEGRERLLGAMLNHLTVIVWQMTLDGTITLYDGKKGLEVIGRTPGQLVGQNMFDLYGRQGTNAAISQALEGHVHFSSNDVDGRSWHNWTLPLFSDDGVVDGVAGVTLDITALRSGEKELRAKLALIEEQQTMIRALSTPLIETWDGVLTLPMIGTLDTERAAEVMENLLTEITRRQARFAIVDLTGVDAVDTTAAAHIISLIRAIQLLGAEGIVTGIRPSTAQTMVMLGADLSEIRTHANLKEALRFCIQSSAQL